MDKLKRVLTSANTDIEVLRGIIYKGTINTALMNKTREILITDASSGKEKILKNLNELKSSIPQTDEKDHSDLHDIIYLVGLFYADPLENLANGRLSFFGNSNAEKVITEDDIDGMCKIFDDRTIDTAKIMIILVTIAKCDSNYDAILDELVNLAKYEGTIYQDAHW